MMLEKIRTILVEKCGLSPADLVVAGVSGGPDSLCLMYLLHHLGYPLMVAHLDHQLRPESAEEANRVEQMALGLGLRFVQEKLDIRSFSQERKLSLEEGARLARYQFLFTQAEMLNARAVSVGHTADDQVETVLMHLLRGAGSSGLAGMSYRSLPNPWSATIPLIRPLLGVWGQEVWDYLLDQVLTPNLDSSNQDRRFLRNRLRHELIPYLETYNPRLRQVLWRTADILQQENEILQTIVAVDWEKTLCEHDQGTLNFDIDALQELPLGRLRRVIHQAVYTLRPNLRDLDYQVVERAVDFIQHKRQRLRMDLIAGLQMVRSEQRLTLSDNRIKSDGGNWPQVPSNKELQLVVPGRLNLDHGWVLIAEFMEYSEDIFEQVAHNQDGYQAWLDYDSLQLPLTVRGRLSGDQFQPLGMKTGSIKISDFMINVKLPQTARPRWPLALSGDRIAWLPGYRPAHAYRVTGNTTCLVHLLLEREIPL